MSGGHQSPQAINSRPTRQARCDPPQTMWPHRRVKDGRVTDTELQWRWASSWGSATDFEMCPNNKLGRRAREPRDKVTATMLSTWRVWGLGPAGSSISLSLEADEEQAPHHLQARAQSSCHALRNTRSPGALAKADTVLRPRGLATKQPRGKRRRGGGSTHMALRTHGGPAAPESSGPALLPGWDCQRDSQNTRVTTKPPAGRRPTRAS